MRIEEANGRLGKGESDGEPDGVSGIEGGTGNRGNDKGDCGGARVAGGLRRVDRTGLVR